MFEHIILQRILLAFFAGGIIGLERQFKDKPAGFTTNSLICVGATIFTIISIEFGSFYGSDSARIAAQIIPGVGFLGAGAIMRDGLKVSGLTTAAIVWLVSAIGMAIGFGQYFMALIALCGALILQILASRTANVLEKVRFYDILHIICDPSWEIVDEICKIIEKDGAKIIKRTVSKENGMFVLDITAAYNSKDFDKITKSLFEMKEVKKLTR
jgi:putative Mg2+ transporter-C (MgtC) family protein